MRRSGLSVVAALGVGCVPADPSLDGSEFSCPPPAEACPAGFECDDGVCRRADGDGGPDAGRARAGVQFDCLYAPHDASSRVAVLDAMRSAGIEAVRIELDWSGIEETGPGEQSEGYLATADACVAAARVRELAVTFAVFGTPAWANAGAGEFVPPDDPADYAAFLGWAADRWSGEVEAWQIWIEPERDQAFDGDVATYAALLGAAYPAIKAADPTALVVLGAPTSNDDDWIEEVYAAGAAPSFDVLAVEPFPGVSDSEPERPDDGSKFLFSHFPAVREVMAAHGDGDKPVWFTGFGWSAHANADGIPEYERGVTEAEQADFAVRAFELAAASFDGVESMFWHREWSRPQDDLHQRGFGLLREDLTERPVLGALRDFLLP